MDIVIKCPFCNSHSQHFRINKKNLLRKIILILDYVYYDYRRKIEVEQQITIENYLKYVKQKFPLSFGGLLSSKLDILRCSVCGEHSIWIEGKIIYPKGGNIDPPNEDMTEEIKSLYKEAAVIFEDSPRGSAALLRLGLQLLLIQIGKKGKNINDDIKELVKDGLDIKVQKSLDILRVVGNNAVHPGQINLNDNKEIALNLFRVLNIIAEEMLSKPKRINELYDNLPEKVKNAIKNRDKN